MTTYKGSSAGFAVPKFVPEIWTGRLIANLQGKCILPALCTREFEGEIKNAGDTVWVNGVGRVATNDYLVNDTQVDYQEATDGKVGINVEKAKYWAIKMEDIEQVQSKPAYVNEYTKEAAFALAKDVDRYLYTKFLAASTEAANDLGYAGGGDLGLLSIGGGVEFYDHLVDIGVAMDDALAPDAGRFTIVPSFAEGMIRKDDRFVANGQDSGNSLKKGGSIGMLADIEIITMPRGYFGTALNGGSADGLSAAAVRNLNSAHVGVGALEAAGVAPVDDYRCIAGVRGSMAYVEQFAKTEKLRLEKSFADAVRGLLLFGGGSIKPNQIWQFSLDDPKVTTVES